MLGDRRTLPSMSLVTLNADILTEIVSFLSTDEAFRLSLTTKQIHAIAMRQVFRIIDLKQLGYFKRVCVMLLQEPARRLVFVRELRISSAALKDASKATIARFAALLSHPSAAHIHSLGLGSIEWLLVQQPSCADAVAALPTLTQLELWGVGSDSLAMVEKLTSKPRKLALQFGLHFLEEDPIPALFSEARGTPIENPGFSTTSFTTTIHHTPPNSCSQWSSLYRLSLMNCKLPMSVFVLAFPNVKRLCLRQITSSLPSQNDGICWPRLDFLDMGDVTYRHPWKVTCPVRHLVLHISREVVFSWYLLKLVETTMPIVLELEMALELHARFWKKLGKLGKRLRYLIIVLKDAGTSPSCEYAQNLNQWKLRLPSYISTLKISCLRICYPSSLPAAHDILQDVPQILMPAIPSLCYIALEHRHPSERSSWYEGGYDGSGSIWWRITRVGMRDWEGLSRMTTELGESIDNYMKSDELESEFSLPL